MQLPPEKVGSFYLGAEYDLATSTRKDIPIIYDARDLLTHGVVVGMTGSGKTGLCIDLLEEAALDKIPVIIIDPKGDMANLLLQFPQLRPEDFAPWIDAGDAERKGISSEEMAVSTAQKWSEGLADWGIAGDRMRTLQATVEYTVYTPGSDAGIPVSIVGSFKAPTLDWASEGEAIRERITGTVAALFSMMGENADPVRSREGVLLASIIEHYWKQGQDISMEVLIKSIQTPPMDQVGVFEVDTFFPAKDRFGMALALNTLIASPSFKSWLEGAPMDVHSFLYTPEGKPRHSIFYIAHLSDSERMFFVTLLLENILTWTRTQSGTTSLRAILYFDEVFGYLPPTAEPASKRPMMTLLKQARAFGLGVLLATQNPADLDYKALTNTGTWIIGKLQAERDKMRLIEGLQGLSEGGPAKPLDYDKLIPELGNRVFLLHNVHADGPVVMTTRWAQSYLRGPLTKPQVKLLMDPQRAALVKPVEAALPLTPAEPVGSAASTLPLGAHAIPAPADLQPASAVTAPAGFSITASQLGDNVQQVYLPVALNASVAENRLAQDAGGVAFIRKMLVYTPAVLGVGTVNFVDAKLGVRESHEHHLLAFAPGGLGTFSWDGAEELKVEMRDLLRKPEEMPGAEGPYFAAIPDGARSAADYKKAQSELTDWFYRSRRIELKAHDSLDVSQKPGESEVDFHARVRQAADARIEAELKKIEPKQRKALDDLRDKIAKAQVDADQADVQAKALRNESYANIFERIFRVIIGFLDGRKSVGSLSPLMSKNRRADEARARADEKKRVLDQLKAREPELVAANEAEVQEIRDRWAAELEQIGQVEVAPRRTDINVDLVALAWTPEWMLEYSEGGFVRTRTIPAHKA